MLNTLKASNRNCRFIPSRTGKLLNKEKSVLKTAGPRKALRPRFPNPPDGIPNAQGLNHVSEVWVLSAARPPCEMVFWQSGSGLAATGPAANGSAITLGRR